LREIAERIAASGDILDKIQEGAPWEDVQKLVEDLMPMDVVSIVRRYREIVDWIGKKQPEATLVLEANLHVTGEKSARNGIYNNQRITH
ncbi:hypothetical protein NE476_30725, partial [Enterocloster bolteae]|nr:hypothetical protein [Enterocloster bolteae]